MKRIVDKRFVPAEVAVEFDKWADYLYDSVDFNMADSEIHSYGHTERVLLHSLIVGRSIFGNDTEALEILAHASLFHDTRRQDDYMDTGHGARAAVNYADFCRRHPELTMHPESQYLMRYHDLDDEIGLSAIRRDFSGEKAERVATLYRIFKDADALDRWRLGSCGLDSKYLRTEKAKSMTEFSKLVVVHSMDPELLHHIDMLVKSSLARKMLLIVDPQLDFITGTLPVPNAEKAMNNLSEYIAESDGEYHLKIVTADCHPWNHCSFSENGGKWPRHCVAHSVGAAIWPPLLEALHLTAGRTLTFNKGKKADKEEYSIFQNERAAKKIIEIVNTRQINQIDICGLAGDICVAATLKDGAKIMPDVKFNLLEAFSPRINLICRQARELPHSRHRRDY